jgi:large subunit ribosomal protein L15
MKLNELKPAEGAVFKKMRVGRGSGSGKGKTCGRGIKGQKARTGVSINGFEGGQMPLYRRLPKRGFTNIHAKEFATLTLARLQEAIDSKKLDVSKTVDEAALVEAGVIRHKRDGVRLIGGGELKGKVSLVLTGGATGGAEKAVKKAGGSIETASGPKPFVRKGRESRLIQKDANNKWRNDRREAKKAGKKA